MTISIGYHLSPYKISSKSVQPFRRERVTDRQSMDNARPHRARIVQEYLEEVEVSRMEWPARSPDLNLIEQVWDNLNRRLRSSENHSATFNDLGTQLTEISEGLDQNILRSLILSMNRRCRAVINERGGNTKY